MCIRRLVVLAVFGAALRAQSSSKPPEEGPDQERRRAEWFLQQRSTPIGIVPTDLRLKALREMEAPRTAAWARRLSVLPAAASAWQNIGPFSLMDPFSQGPVSGRVNAVAA